MPIYVGTVTIKKRDNTLQATVEHIVISGREYDDMKRNVDNLKRALRWMGQNKGKSTKEDYTRWVITGIIIHKELGIK